MRLLAIGILLGLALPAVAENEQPNFLFILADDLGCKDLSGEGSSFYETPRIDSIANDGMRFTQGYAACQVCSPSRASIMLGTYPARHGITDWIGAASGLKWRRNDRVLPAEYEHNLPLDQTTVAEALRDAGYATFFAGKWHLGGEGSMPEDHGFDINRGGHHRGSPPGGFFSPYKNPKLTDGPAGESLPIRLADETAGFIRDSADRPFFAFLSFYSVHGPIQTTPELWKKYRDKVMAGEQPEERFLIDRTLPVRQVQDCPIYAGMMESMDNAVGIVLDTLQQTGLDKNTVVIFTSDNGGVSSGDAFATSNLPFRGGKGRQWEGGLREPFYIKAPGITAAGSHCDTPVIGTDFYPTLLELAGLASPKGIDGVSLVPLLRGRSIESRPLFWHYPHYGNQGGEPSSIIRDGDWKLIHYYEDGRDELYHLADDIGEQTDRATKQPELASRLRVQLDAWLEATGARIPQPDPRFDAAKKEQQQQQIESKRKPALERQHARFLAEDFQPNKDWWGSKVTRD
ncbi:Arylsulfatase precursor [Rosistilla ulvae]|uniref:Arylsulfatase n=1 Tax=Rosistilla ulvae TaxID=1930277 RepID=A0A517M895_9BACT|nr:sulfatase [Rosistilla ulvae]QDS91007.1 Arylsulfatase precursor [Rosistilla ulvae]